MRKKCDQYWPTRGTETYGLMTVTITATQELATYSIRTFQLTRNGSNESREIKQVQYTAWPDHGNSLVFTLIKKRLNNFIKLKVPPPIQLLFCSFLGVQNL